jgi:preprotein translocase subunit Sec61beta
MAEKSAGINLPGSFGGLMSYNQEYESRFNLKPTHVIAFILLIIAFRIFLGVYF